MLSCHLCIFDKMFFSCLIHILIGFFYVGFWKFFVCPRCWFRVGYMVCKYTVPFCSLPFHLLNGSENDRSFKLKSSPIINFSFYEWCFGDLLDKESNNPLSRLRSQRFSPILFLKVFVLSFYIEGCDAFWVNFCVRCEPSVEFNFFFLWISSCPTAVCWKGYFSSNELLSHLCKNISWVYV